MEVILKVAWYRRVSARLPPPSTPSLPPPSPAVTTMSLTKDPASFNAHVWLTYFIFTTLFCYHWPPPPHSPMPRAHHGTGNTKTKQNRPLYSFLVGRRSLIWHTLLLLLLMSSPLKLVVAYNCTLILDDITCFFSKFHRCCLKINELRVVYSKALYLKVTSFVWYWVVLYSYFGWYYMFFFSKFHRCCLKINELYSYFGWYYVFFFGVSQVLSSNQWVGVVLYFYFGWYYMLFFQASRVLCIVKFSM